MNLQELMQWLIPDAEECRRSAAELRLDNASSTDVQIARRAVKHARKWAASVGAATGVAASPITMLPAAIADAAAMLKIEGQLAGTIAGLLDPESLSEPENFRKDIMRVIFPGAVSQVLRKLGIRAGEEVTKSVVRKLATKVAVDELGERAVKMLSIRLTEKAVATKTVPIVGAAIGAGWNWLEVQAVGQRAIDYHLGLELAESRVTKNVKKVASIVKESVRDRVGKGRSKKRGK
jgi:hypothetical protein